MAETLENLIDFAKERLSYMKENSAKLSIGSEILYVDPNRAMEIHIYENFLESHGVEVEKEAEDESR